MKKVRLHKHWVFSKGGYSFDARNILHPVSTKHQHPKTQMYHDMKTGKFSRWIMKNKLRLVDSTYDKYLRKLKKK